MTVRSSAWQVKQLLLSRSKAVADETPPFADGWGAELVAPYMPCEYRLVDHLQPTAQTGQYNSTCSFQRKKRQEENANSQLRQQGEKILQKMFYSVWSPSTLLSHLFSFFIIFVHFLIITSTLQKHSPPYPGKAQQQEGSLCLFPTSPNSFPTPNRTYTEASPLAQAPKC